MKLFPYSPDVIFFSPLQFEYLRGGCRTTYDSYAKEPVGNIFLTPLASKVACYPAYFLGCVVLIASRIDVMSTYQIP